MDDPSGAVHLPTLDYVVDSSGALLPLPVLEEEFEERQSKKSKKQAIEDKKAETEQWELIAEDTAAAAYDPEGNPYEGIAWRNDYDIWYGAPEDATDDVLGGEQGEAKNKRKKGEEEQEEEEEPKKKAKKTEAKGRKRKGGRTLDRAPGSLGRTMQLRQFHIDMVKPDYTLVFYGKRRSGKSFLMRWLLYKLRKEFPMGICITKTKINGYWQEHIPDEFVHQGMSETVLRQFQEAQKVRRDMWKENPSYNPNGFLILEDCVDQKFRYDTTVEEMFYLGRHLKCCCFVASQW